MTWLLVYSKPNNECLAKNSLEREGLEAYLPQIQCVVNHAGRVKEVERPFFPRYLFARESSGFDPVSMRYLMGVSNIIRGGQQLYARMTDALIDGLKAREVDGFIQLEAPLAVVPFRRGDKVSVNVFGDDGVVGEFLRMRSSDRVVVLLSWFNGTREATVGMHQIKRLAS